jgi:predicted transcriptional regulator
MATVRVRPETRFRLANLREHPRESFDTIINRLIDFYKDDDPLTREDIEGIKESLQELREGRFFTHEEVKEKLGLDQGKPFTLIYAPRAVKDLEELSGEESGKPGHSEPCEDEIQAIKEFEMKKRRNSTRLNLL